MILNRDGIPIKLISVLGLLCIFSEFKNEALRIGYQIESFSVFTSNYTRLFSAIIRRIPFLNKSIALDIFSGARAILIKE